MNAHAVRTLFVAALMALAGVSTATLKPASDASAPAPDLDVMLPDAFGPWRRAPLSDAVLPQEVDLNAGEAVAYRAYEDDLGRVVTLVAAFGPPLGDSVRLHQPERCYVAQGFLIRERLISGVDFDGRAIPIVHLDAESPTRREAVTYWLREGAEFTTKASDRSWRRIARGFSPPVDGALLRLSTINAENPQFDLHREFLTEFAAALGPEARATLLGAEPAT